MLNRAVLRDLSKIVLMAALATPVLGCPTKRPKDPPTTETTKQQWQAFCADKGEMNCGKCAGEANCGYCIPTDTCHLFSVSTPEVNEAVLAKCREQAGTSTASVFAQRLEKCPGALGEE